MTYRHAIVPALLLTMSGCGGSTGPVVGAEEAVAVLAASQLEHHGCGYQFTVGSPDGRVRLTLSADAGFGAAPEPGSHELGDDWTARLVAGRDLFAQWCDDVIEPGEPEVVEEASWAVRGVVTWELVEGDGGCASVATAVLTDARIEEAGRTTPLPEIAFRNESFGCFAG